jgi:multimeric flavodoxin WrbA
MSKRVLILSGSPRKGGNSEVLCDQFMKGAQEAGHQVEKIRVAEKRIGYCTGCYGCQGGGKCVRQDDMEPLLESMIASDVIVLATPVYFYTLCAQMKTVIDRTVARYTEITGKEFYFIFSAADERQGMLERTVEAFRGFLDCLDGAREMGIVYGLGSWSIGDIVNQPAMKQAYELGKGA